MTSLDISNVTEDMLPPVGSIWQDTLAYTKREIKVLRVRPAGTIRDDQVWLVDAQENYGWQRTFQMYAHGFLTRFKPIEGI